MTPPTLDKFKRADSSSSRTRRNQPEPNDPPGGPGVNLSEVLAGFGALKPSPAICKSKQSFRKVKFYVIPKRVCSNLTGWHGIWPYRFFLLSSHISPAAWLFLVITVNGVFLGFSVCFTAWVCSFPPQLPILPMTFGAHLFGQLPASSATWSPTVVAGMLLIPNLGRDARRPNREHL